jgi:flagellar protein FlbD
LIRVTRLDGSELTINCDMLEMVEATPDTVLSLVNNHKLVVKEGVEEIVSRVVEYRHRTNLCPFMRSGVVASPPQPPVDRNLIR